MPVKEGDRKGEQCKSSLVSRPLPDFISQRDKICEWPGDEVSKRVLWMHRKVGIVQMERGLRGHS